MMQGRRRDGGDSSDGTGVDAAILIGHHGQAGSASSVISHTFSDALAAVRVNGRPYGEIGLNTALAGTYGTPVVLLPGGDTACTELRDLVPDATTVEVKRALGQSAADCLHPSLACEAIERAAAAAVADRGTLPPLRIPGRSRSRST